MLPPERTLGGGNVMKSLLPLVALAMLAACNQSSPVADKAQAATPAAGPHSNAAPGTYVYTDAKGSMVTAFLSDDGLYTNWIAGAMVERGKWAIENNKTCFHPENSEVRCQSDGPMAADGSYTVTPDKGAPYTVTKR
jgi:hypothetical protein